ncbi:hypothetical protein LAZ67_13000655 [Cordylochernes scorpioides]|uniref:Uncharacterized protein n=1 Tax=Cordylochernes scorpioides TaxID=51811 RepID=A0ABY6L507_9ARAC|nr:hypothetical protein LAZ67_13000655 [Cordylochernes scorpioides]
MQTEYLRPSVNENNASLKQVRIALQDAWDTTFAETCSDTPFLFQPQRHIISSTFYPKLPSFTPIINVQHHFDPDLDGEISFTQVATKISKLRKNKATGLDNIPNEAIQFKKYMRSDVDLHAALPVAQNKQGRVQDLGRGFCPISIIPSPQTPNFAASKQLSILQCNINGMCSTATKIKLEEIMELAGKKKIQIIALQETKLNEKYKLKYKNYNILRKYRNKEGVA